MKRLMWCRRRAAIATIVAEIEHVRHPGEASGLRALPRCAEALFRATVTNRDVIGPLMAKRPLPLPKPLRIVRNHPRLILAAALGAVVALVLPNNLRPATRLLIGWDIGAICYLAAAFMLVQD